MGGSRNQTRYPSAAPAMLYQLPERTTEETSLSSSINVFSRFDYNMLGNRRLINVVTVAPAVADAHLISSVPSVPLFSHQPGETLTWREVVVNEGSLSTILVSGGI